MAPCAKDAQGSHNQTDTANQGWCGCVEWLSSRLVGRAPQVEEYYHAAHQKYVPFHQHFRVPDEVYYKRTETTAEDLPKALTRVCACAFPGRSVCQLLSFPRHQGGAVRLRGSRQARSQFTRQSSSAPPRYIREHFNGAADINANGAAGASQPPLHKRSGGEVVL